MSIKQFPKHNFSVDIPNDDPTCMLRFVPTITGYLDHVRVKIINRNWDGSGKAKLRIRTESGALIAESDYIYFEDYPTDLTKFYYGYADFKFNGASVQSGESYFLCLTQEDATVMGTSFFSWIVDHNFPTNTNIDGSVDPISNMRLSAELFFKGDYNELD